MAEKRKGGRYLYSGLESGRCSAECFMIKTIVFDIGNVLMHFKWMEHCGKLFPDEETSKAVNMAMFGSGLWNHLDRGDWDGKTALEAFCAQDPAHAEEIRLAWDNMGPTLVPDSYSIPWLLELRRRGYRLLYLSNYSREAIEAGPEALSFLPYMDGGVFSFLAREIKPAPGIYEKLIKLFGLDPTECVFLDDTGPNLKAAAEFGFRTIRFRNYEQGKAELDALLEAEGEPFYEGSDYAG